MLTALDKAIVAFLIPLIVFVNQKWGFTLPVDANTLGLLVAAVDGGLVYLVPNKKV